MIKCQASCGVRHALARNGGILRALKSFISLQEEATQFLMYPSIMFLMLLNGPPHSSVTAERGLSPPPPLYRSTLGFNIFTT